MPKIETQGLSEDYQTATGLYDAIERGEVNKEELLQILERVSKLATPPGEDQCSPTVNTMLVEGYYSCFFSDNNDGLISCIDSQQETMTPAEATQIMCGEMTIEEFDLSKGYKPQKTWPYKLAAALFVVFVIYTIIKF